MSELECPRKARILHLGCWENGRREEGGGEVGWVWVGGTRSVEVVREGGVRWKRRVVTGGRPKKEGGGGSSGGG